MPCDRRPFSTKSSLQFNFDLSPPSKRNFQISKFQNLESRTLLGAPSPFNDPELRLPFLLILQRTRSFLPFSSHLHLHLQVEKSAKFFSSFFRAVLSADRKHLLQRSSERSSTMSATAATGSPTFRRGGANRTNSQENATAFDDKLTSRMVCIHPFCPLWGQGDLQSPDIKPLAM